MIAIIDYGSGNIKSLQFALEKVGLSPQITIDETVIATSDAIILPGVGAFQDAMQALNNQGLTEIIKREADNGKPVLGICLGMQLFYEISEEDGEAEGLGLLKGRVSKITGKVKVPHMGWNSLSKHQSSPLVNQILEYSFVYFVHSYAVKEYAENTLIATCDYAGTIPAIVQQGNIIGMQFHPEKSGDIGLKLLENVREMML
ncbi:imidazole glycerol phosphate synthase subunit HisH [Virgibacillus proomii]|uniref:imidazole glycerol phosphate synthase subunit HisH n=1 Tax=Virgibacillus proomii TaxID=84407 RepID=UPI001C114F34|nr:imidazole glycerol phosphate synthase subunit HisH [Virgibacillus proomii]MBU5265487.1 imidazole glycerol phosphate synthase subunit HisH [Virgibacillus proomii]